VGETRARVGSGLVLGLVAAVLAACGGAEEGAGSASAGEAVRVTVGETEFALAVSQTSLDPGSYTFVVTNDGTVDHALEVEGPGVDEAETETLAPGESAELTVTLETGTYKLYCPVGGHEDLGMKLELGVGGAAAESPPPPAPPAGGGYGSYGSAD